jgi:DNA-binding winged helix-turn-helix (wHTH) protein
MSQSSPPLPLVRFAQFELDSRAGELRKEGRRIKLQEQPLQILAMLLERPGELVTREELRQKLWPADTFVDFDHGLNSAVARLREALNDSAQCPKYIETVTRRGYRFIGKREETNLTQAAAQEPPQPDKPWETDLSRRSRMESSSIRNDGCRPWRQWVFSRSFPVPTFYGIQQARKR